MGILSSYADVTKETVSVKGSSFPFLSLRELVLLLKEKRSSLDIFHYPESDISTQIFEEKEIKIGQLLSRIYQKFLYSREEESETYTPEFPIDVPVVLPPVVEWVKNLQELEQIALFTISRKFSKIEKVKSIYVQRYREELQIQVLLSIDHYDYDLMDTLLDIEYDIRKMFPEIVFEFFYPPAGISEKKDFIHPQAECIYMR